MRLIDSVRWPALIEQVAGGVGEQTREAATNYAGDRGIHQFFRAGVGLAALITGYSPYLLAMDLARQGLDRDDAERLAEWLTGTAHVSLRFATAEFDAELDDAEPAEPGQPGTLFVDEALPYLPLLPLAAAWAEQVGDFRVLAAELPAGIAGMYTAAERTVRLDLRHDPAGCFPHELAHALDPDRGQRGDPVADELAAEVLGALLMRDQPWTVAEALPLVAEASAQVPTAADRAEQRVDTDADLPGPGVVSLIVFASLPNRQ